MKELHRLFLSIIFAASANSQLAAAEPLRPDFGISATFSMVAVDPETGTCGAAVASKYPAVGKFVPYRSKPKTLRGLHAGKVRTHGDLIQPSGEVWDAER